MGILGFRLVCRHLFGWLSLVVLPTAGIPGGEVRLKGTAGEGNRVDAVVQQEFPLQDFLKRAGSKALEQASAEAPLCWSLYPEGAAGPVRPVEVEKTGNVVRLTWIEPGAWPAGEKREWILKPTAPDGFRSPWTWHKSDAGQWELHHARRGLVCVYRAEPENKPGLPTTQNRGAYIHPFLTPSGKTATGDFSPFHTHHRGFFLAYAKTSVGDQHPDFWNIHGGTAKIVALKDSIRPVAGPVIARLSARHAWQLREKARPEHDSGDVVAEEDWAVSVYDVPGEPAWIWDVVSTQTPKKADLTLVKHRYGGMAYRGPEPFVKGKLDVLTSEGADTRAKADQKPARWIDLTGPVAEGSPDYVGAVMCDHPSNVRFPNVVRIHPTLLPFFSFVPAHREDLRLEAGKPATWRYRTMVHDGHPDRARNEALFQDFARPVEVRLAD